ncbi:RPTOR isoform 11, partial [Pan troglodytes]
ATVNARPQRVLDTSSLTQSAPASPTNKGVHIHQAGGSPPASSTSSSSLTNDVAKQPVSRDLPSGRPGTTGPAGAQYTPHSHQFPRTRKMFDKGPEQVRRPGCLVIWTLRALLLRWGLVASASGCSHHHGMRQDLPCRPGSVGHSLPLQTRVLVLTRAPLCLHSSGVLLGVSRFSAPGSGFTILGSFHVTKQEHGVTWLCPSWAHSTLRPLGGSCTAEHLF